MSRIAALLALATFLPVLGLATGCGARAGAEAKHPTELTGAEDKERDGTARPPSGGIGEVRGSSTFPQDDARTALRAAQGGLRSCSESAIPRSVDVRVRFESTGKVSKVDVVPPDGRAASCVRTRLGEVAITPFKGDPVTLQMTVQL
jgi:hypothetical protein